MLPAGEYNGAQSVILIAKANSVQVTLDGVERTSMMAQAATPELEFRPGLEGVVAAETRLSLVDGEQGVLIIGGYPVELLAQQATFEEVVYLLWRSALPTATELEEFRASIAARRALPLATVDLLRAVAEQGISAIDALRIAAGTLDLDLRGADDTAMAQAVLARLPVAVAAFWRLRQGQTVVEPRPDLGHAANYLYMLTGQEPAPALARGLETYLNTVVDHGLNASTFAARVIIATQSDMVSAVVGAIGALKGPRHGGAPGPALDMVFAIGQPENAEPYMRAKLEQGERLMGFGHRIYKVRDPRADVLAEATEQMFAKGADLALYQLAKDVERVALALLKEYKPRYRLQTNVEFYTALLLHGLGLETELFTPTFAVGRCAGWIAHCFEQQATGRIIRPQSRYVGPMHTQWTPVEER
jgi:citrate synthase